MNTDAARTVGLINSFFRSCVPLFVMLSGYFLFPVADLKSFLAKRLTRLIIPFAIWSSIYAFYQYFRGITSLEHALISICKIPINLSMESGHLWFLYMLIGIYLFAPIVSGWIQSATKNEMHYFLFLWTVTLLTPYIHLIFPMVWGEVPWNNHPMLHYFMNYLGYIVLANYLKRFHSKYSKGKYAVAFGLILVGYAITAFGFLYRLPTAHSIPSLELTWDFNTINIAMIATGFFLLAQNLPEIIPISKINGRIHDISSKCFGMYLAHIIILNAVFAWINPIVNTTVLKLPLIASITFVLTYILIKLLSKVPKGKWITG